MKLPQSWKMHNANEDIIITAPGAVGPNECAWGDGRPRVMLAAEGSEATVPMTTEARRVEGLGLLNPEAAEMADKIVLGDEFDDELRDVVRDVLRERGAQPTASSWAVGGSQCLETLSLKMGDRVVVLEAETYIGLSISGDSILVQEVAARVRKRLPTLESRDGGMTRTWGDD